MKTFITLALLLLTVSSPAQALIVAKPKTCADKVTTEYLSKAHDLRQATKLGSIQSSTYKDLEIKLRKMYQIKVEECLFGESK